MSSNFETRMDPCKLGFLVALGFGGVLMNTLPLWIGEMAISSNVSDALAGAAGSVVLLLVAILCTILRSQRAAAWGGYTLVLSLLLFAFSVGSSKVLVLIACGGIGVSMGVVLSGAFAHLAQAEDPQGVISIAVTAGLIASLAAYLIVALTPISIQWVLVVFAVPVAIVCSAASENTDAHPDLDALDIAPLPKSLIPFFVMMGAYWAFLDVYGAQYMERQALELWLLGTLLTGAAGSAAAGLVPQSYRRRMMGVALGLAALTGALTYVGLTGIALGLAILANAFFLFLFVPLYLVESQTQMAQRMALYLASFAFGGGIGALLLNFGGYTALAAVTASTGLLAVPLLRQTR